MHRTLCVVHVTVGRTRKWFTESELLSLPIARCSKPAQLVLNLPRLLILPRPYTLFKLFSSEGLPGLAFPCQLLLYNHLGSNAGMISPRNIQNRPPSHAMEAAHNVLYRHEHGVAHVQYASHVGRRHDHREGVVPSACLWPEVPSSLPLTIDDFFFGWIEVLG